MNANVNRPHFCPHTVVNQHSADGAIGVNGKLELPGFRGPEKESRPERTGAIEFASHGDPRRVGAKTPTHERRPAHIGWLVPRGAESRKTRARG
jgi:hypothetical protein